MRTKRKENGFTLAEVLVTIAILLVLMLLGFTAYLFWMKNSSFKYNNENAQTFFALTQTNLSAKRNNGTLEEWKDRLDKLAVSDSSHCGTLTDATLDSLTLPDGTSYTNGYRDVYTGYQLTGGPIYYLMGTAEEYQDYLDGNATGAVKVLFDLLSEYVLDSDDDVMNADFCIEFDPAEGLVYSVFYRSSSSKRYADDTSRMSYSDATLKDRSEETRETYMIGYYGVTDLSQSNTASSARTTISNLSLNNGETLNLTFNVGVGNISEVDPGIFYYQIVLYDADTSKKLMAITINDTEESALTSGKGSLVSAEVTKYADDGSLVSVGTDASGNSVTERTIVFPAWIENSGITFVLDAIDFSATSYTNLQSAAVLGKSYYSFVHDNTGAAYCEALMNTASIYRLGLQNTDNIYCKVVCLGDGYKTSIEKQSNTEARAFSTMSTENGRVLANNNASVSGKTRTCGIVYSRHLYNIRFEEAGRNANDTNVYSVSRDVKWTNTTGASSDGVIYNALTAYNDKTERAALSFPSIPKLSAGSALTSANAAAENYGYSLTGFSISKEQNTVCALYSESDTNRPTGLVAVNSGKMDGITMKDAKVTGEAYTGSFAGINSGSMDYLKTTATTYAGDTSEASAYVSGTDHVGGIFGMFSSESSDRSVSVSNLSNSAMVSGTRYVGGILGIAVTETDSTGSITIANCENYGFIRGIVENDTDPQYLGGIVGLSANQLSDETGLVIKNCISIPRQGKSESVLLNPDNGYIHGICVGGIVGLAYNTAITNCETFKDKYYSNGFVVGKEFVGGIAGLYVGSGLIGTEDSSDYCINQARVFGDSYVGGIVGCNADVYVKKSNGKGNGTNVSLETYIETYTGNSGKNSGTWYDSLDASVLNPVSAANYSLKVQGWENRGIVVSLTDYAGGITGYNTGIVSKCISNVSSNGTSFLSADSKYGDYVGGISGYNKGIITASDYVVTVIADPTNNGNGNSWGTFKKGDVFYRASYAKDAANTLHVNAVVSGNDYVGGIVGYNDTGAVVEDYQVTGGTIKATGSCVGGYAGFNESKNLFVKGNGTVNEIVASASAISGTYFVGGVVGLNAMASDEAVTARMQVDNLLANVTGKAVVGGFIGYSEMLSEKATVTEDTVDAFISGISAKSYDSDFISFLDNGLSDTHSAAAFTIGNDGTTLKATNAKITAELCAGGVIGYDQKDSKLVLNNIRNASYIKTTENIRYAKTSTTDAPVLFESKINTAGISLSFTGGITGYINGNTTVKNCSNVNTGDVSASGTYTGGLAEVNSGSIINCTIGTSVSGKEFVGGLCGINYGTVDGANAAENARVNGNGGNYIGGVVAENYGTVNCKGTGTVDVEATGDFVGGIVAYNGGTGTVKLAGSVSVSVNTEGDTVGGLVGVNCGKAVITTSAAANSVKGAVVGADTVGGICGNYTSQTNLTNLTNRASVSASDGDAAGIACLYVVSVSSSVIQKCSNYGSVTSASGDAAGVILNCVKSCQINTCANHGSVTAPKGSAAGICIKVYNGGGILSADVSSASESEKIDISGAKNAAGIACENDGSISVLKVYNISVSNSPDSETNTCTGGFVGVNNKGKNLKLLYNGTFSGISVKSYVGDISIGGIAAYNYGVIYATDWSTYKKPAVVSIDNINGESISSADIGGVAGTNYSGASVKYIEVQNPSDNMMSANLTSSDLTGNYGGVAGVNGGTILECSFNGKITITGNKKETTLGGIAGLNEETASVTKCYLADQASALLHITSTGCLGGIVGWNDGSVTGCNCKDSDRMAESVANMLKPCDYRSSDSQVDNEYSKIKNSYRAVIINRLGYVGGICGYLSEGAICTGTENAPIKTGEWFIEEQLHMNDDGAAGIIGFSASSENMAYMYNYANVFVSFLEASLNNLSIGGILGLSYNTERVGQTLTYCENHAEIYSTSANYTSGILGRIDGFSCQIDHCLNEGDVYGGAASGILSIIYYHMNGDTTLAITNCTNTGNIYYRRSAYGNAKNEDVAAGIYAGPNAKRDITPVVIADCVNAGTIAISKEANNYADTQLKIYIAGITSNYPDNEKYNKLKEVVRCRNYGCVYNYLNTENAWSISRTSSYNSKAVVYDCFNFHIADAGCNNTVIPLTRKKKDTADKEAVESYTYKHATDASVAHRMYIRTDDKKNYCFIKCAEEGTKLNNIDGIPSANSRSLNSTCALTKTQRDEANNKYKGNYFYDILETKQDSLPNGNSYMEQYYLECNSKTTTPDLTINNLAAASNQGILSVT